MAGVIKIAVFASGSGTNFQQIAEYFADHPRIEIACLLTDRDTAYAAERAQQLGIPHHLVVPQSFATKEAYETEICRILAVYPIDLIVLAGYMRIVSDTLLTAYPNRLLNIHPSLLPAFPGKQGILDAYEAGVSETGVTVHLVDAGVDTGPILGQKALTIEPEMSLGQLTERIHELEYVLYPEIIEKYVQNL